MKGKEGRQYQKDTGGEGKKKSASGCLNHMYDLHKK